MLSSEELLQRLSDKGVKKSAIAATLGIDPAGVSRLYNGTRQLTLDEAKKLADRFSVTVEESTGPLSVPIARLLVLYGSSVLGLDVAPEDPRIEELARDFRAFSMFATDPRVRENEAAVEAFFQGLRLAPSRTSERSA